MSLHNFGLSGVQRPSYYESNPSAIREAAAAFDLKSRLLANAPQLSMLMRSDPASRLEAMLKDELAGVLALAAQETRGLA